MRGASKFRHGVHLLLLAAAFVISTYAVSNLMPLLLKAAEIGFNASDAASIILDLVAGITSVAFLAREVYRLDKQAGRIRNRVGWFE
jgi:hypothetical protein